MPTRTVHCQCVCSTYNYHHSGCAIMSLRMRAAPLPATPLPLTPIAPVHPPGHKQTSTIAAPPPGGICQPVRLLHASAHHPTAQCCCTAMDQHCTGNCSMMQQGQSTAANSACTGIHVVSHHRQAVPSQHTPAVHDCQADIQPAMSAPGPPHSSTTPRTSATHHTTPYHTIPANH
jgi:hypothetical protein